MNEKMTFSPAKRKASFARLALVGASGSGKTFSAIRVARGLVGPEGRIAVVDTENGSAVLYEGLGKTELQPTGFDVMELGPPWNVPRFEAAIKLAVDERYDAVILDQVSWLWEGDGGLLETVDKLASSSTSKDGWGAWKKVTPLYWDFVRAILLAPIHIIVCMRSKVAWEVQLTEKGKHKPVKIGTKPIQREGFDYEMTVVWSLNAENGAQKDKDRTNLFGKRLPLPLTEEDGAMLGAWLKSGDAPTIDADAADLLPAGSPEVKKKAKPVEKPDAPKDGCLNRDQRMEIMAAVKARPDDMGAEEVLALASDVCGFDVSSTAEIPVVKLAEVLARIGA